MNNLLQDGDPPAYISTNDKYLWLSYKPFERLMIEMLPGPSLSMLQAGADSNVYCLPFCRVWVGLGSEEV